MLTERENLEEVIKRGNPERFANQYDAFAFVRNPILKYRNQAKPGEIVMFLSYLQWSGNR